MGGTTTVNQPDGGGATTHICQQANQTYMAVVNGGILSALFVQDSHGANRQQHTHISIKYVLFRILDIL